MYRLKCDGFPLLDSRDDELALFAPQIKVEVNTVGEGSFTIYKDHPHFDKLVKLASVVEVFDEIGVIFRGRITNDTLDFDNGKAVDLEGAMAFFNDTIVRPYSFPGNYLEDPDYIAASESGNVIEFFLARLLDNHNQQADEAHRFKLGRVTVADPNNYLSRSNAEYSTTWDTLKEKLFDSALGGYLCVRYEDDGNYIDYLAEFELTNTQTIEFGENLLDLKHLSDAMETCSAILPLGKADDNEVRLTIADLEDGDVSDDIVKQGDFLYSKSARERCGGLVFVKPSEAVWDDVTDANNLMRKAAEYLAGTAVMFTDTVELSAVDLHFSDEEIQSFRIYRNVNVLSTPHGLAETYKLTKLEIDLLHPQNTKITVGETKLSLIDRTTKDTAQKLENMANDFKAEISSTKNNVADLEAKLDNIEGVDVTEDLEEIRETVETNRTSAEAYTNKIVLEALAEYVSTGDFDAYKQAISSQFEQTAEDFTFNFTNLQNYIANVEGDMQAQYSETLKYIRFVDGNIIMGEEGNPLMLTIRKDRISFTQGGVEVAWMSNAKMYVTDIEATRSLSVGRLKITPRNNGSVDINMV